MSRGSSLAVRSGAGITAAALLGASLVGLPVGPASAAQENKQAAVARSVPDNPKTSVRVVKRGQRVMLRVTARVDGHRLPHNGRRVKDRVKVQVSVPEATSRRDRKLGWGRSRLVSSPFRELTLNDRGKRARGSVRLSQRQVRAVHRLARPKSVSMREAMRSVVVHVRHSSDLGINGRGVDHIAQQVLRVGDRGRVRSGRVSAAGSGATIQFENQTSNPMVLMAGPVSCMYDERYHGITYQSSQQGSQLGAFNGLTLQPGQSTAVDYVESDSDLEDLPMNTDQTGPVARDFEQALINAVQQWGGQGELPDLPQEILAQVPTPDDPPYQGGAEKEISSQIKSFLKTNGKMALKALAESAPEVLGSDASEFVLGALGAASAGWSDLAGPIAALYAAADFYVDRSCNAQPSYVTMGAVNPRNPTQYFMQVYNWNEGQPNQVIDGNEKMPLANGGLVVGGDNDTYTGDRDINDTTTGNLMWSPTRLDNGTMLWALKDMNGSGWRDGTDPSVGTIETYTDPQAGQAGVICERGPSLGSAVPDSALVDPLLWYGEVTGEVNLYDRWTVKLYNNDGTYAYDDWSWKPRRLVVNYGNPIDAAGSVTWTMADGSTKVDNIPASRLGTRMAAPTGAIAAQCGFQVGMPVGYPDDLNHPNGGNWILYWEHSDYEASMDGLKSGYFQFALGSRYATATIDLPPAPAAGSCPISGVGVQSDGKSCAAQGLNLSGRDLSDMVLDNADFTGANLSGANLSGSHLENADLTDANLTGAKLNSAYLFNANLSYADFTNASIQNAVLGTNNTQNADIDTLFNNANLQGSMFNARVLRGANFSGANLTATRWVWTNVTNSSFNNADLTTANFYDWWGTPGYATIDTNTKQAMSGTTWNSTKWVDGSSYDSPPPGVG